MKKTALLLNGPNLNLLGTREPEIYGSTTLKEIEQQIDQFYQVHSIHCHVFQSNTEGAMIDWLHQNRCGPNLEDSRARHS